MKYMILKIQNDIQRPKMYSPPPLSTTQLLFIHSLYYISTDGPLF